MSVYLQNNNKWGVQASCTFKSGNLTNSFDAKDIKADSGWGYGKFAPHRRCTRGDILSGDNGSFVLEVHVTEQISNLVNTCKEQKDELSNLKDSMNEMKALIESLNLSGSISQPAPTLGQVKCPVCMEVVKRPMRLYQCGQVSKKRS